jgi:sensor histidine kinase YesM
MFISHQISYYQVMKNESLTDEKKAGFLGNYSPVKLLIISLISAVFILYPNIAIFAWERNFLDKSKYAAHFWFFIFRYLYFSGFVWVLLSYNLQKIKTVTIKKRILNTLILTLVSYLVYISVSYLLSPKPEWISGLLLFQFFVTFVFCALIGHVSYLYSEKSRRDHEIEQLKIENLKSRYNALTNQINPHFFFNSLNGLTSVIRKNKEDALEYVNKLSDVFRYILQSDKKGLIILGEELEFVNSFLYMLEIRFANKLIFRINVPDDKKDLKIPILSLLPLIENVVMHNTIDSEHKMEVIICINDKSELSVSNPVFPKLYSSESTGTGLKNLDNRFMLLMNSKIRIVENKSRFTVYLPLKSKEDESVDCGG